MAQKIAKSGNNPNFIFNKTGRFQEKIDEISLNELLIVFIKDKQISQKYEKDIVNTLKKNLGDMFNQPVDLFLKKDLSNKIDKLLNLNKKGTAKNLLNYITTLCNFAIKIRHVPKNYQIIK